MTLLRPPTFEFAILKAREIRLSECVGEVHDTGSIVTVVEAERVPQLVDRHLDHSVAKPLVILRPSAEGLSQAR